MAIIALPLSSHHYSQIAIITWLLPHRHYHIVTVHHILSSHLTVRVRWHWQRRWSGVAVAPMKAMLWKCFQRRGGNVGRGISVIVNDSSSDSDSNWAMHDSHEQIQAFTIRALITTSVCLSFFIILYCIYCCALLQWTVVCACAIALVFVFISIIITVCC